MMRNFWILFLVFVFIVNPSLAKNGRMSRQERESLWEEILDARILVTAREFFEKGYPTAFSLKLQEFISNESLRKNLLPRINDRSIFSRQFYLLSKEAKRFVFAGFIWALEEDRNYRLAGPDEEINGQSDKYRIHAEFVRENNKFFSSYIEGKIPKGLRETKARLAAKKGGFPIDRDVKFMGGLYWSEENKMVFDLRLRLPPAFWLTILHHEGRHAYDDIVSYKNVPVPSKSSSGIQLEILGLATGLCVWELVRDDFMKSWEDNGLDFREEFIPAKIMLREILTAEPLFLKYMAGDSVPWTRHIEYQKYQRKAE